MDSWGWSSSIRIDGPLKQISKWKVLYDWKLGEYLSKIHFDHALYWVSVWTRVDG